MSILFGSTHGARISVLVSVDHHVWVGQNGTNSKPVAYLVVIF